MSSKSASDLGGHVFGSFPRFYIQTTRNCVKTGLNAPEPVDVQTFSRASVSFHDFVNYLKSGKPRKFEKQALIPSVFDSLIDQSSLLNHKLNSALYVVKKTKDLILHCL